MTPSFECGVVDVEYTTADEDPATQTLSVSSRSAPGLVPLSVSQNGLWYVSQLAPGSPAYNELIMIRKTGPLEVDALRRALTEVVARHEAWRTTFKTIDGVPHQLVGEPAEVDLPLTDLSDLDPDSAVRRAIEIAAADTLRPYNLAEGPLVRPRLIRVTEDDHRLYLGLHHLVFDEPTLYRVVLPELTALYRCYAAGVASSLPRPQAQYSDYTMWERDWVREPEVADRIAHWHRRLAGSTPTQLPLDHPRPPHQTLAGGTIALTIERTTVERLRRAAQDAGATLFDALAAAYAWWLHLYAGSTDVVFGTTHDLRSCSGQWEVAGYCVAPVVLRCDVSGNEPFTALVSRIRRVVTEALSDVVPFDALVAGLGAPRDPHNNPLFHAALEFRPLVTSAADDWSLDVLASDVRDAVGSAGCDITIELEERPEGHVAGGLVFSTDVFDRETAREMAWHWRRILEVVTAAPGTPMADHDLITPDERRRQLGWNRTIQHDISSQSVHELIDLQVGRTPDAVAVQVDDTSLTYRQLDDRAMTIASRLMQAGAGRGTVVAVILQRTTDLVAALLGVLKSGAAILPLDPRQPIARNAFCINDAGADIVLTDRELPTGDESVTATVINLADFGTHASCHDAPSTTVSPVDVAYVIYTSGSTGRPKPTLIEHRGVMNLMRTMFQEFGVTASDTVLSVASISFDMALGDIFCALACGARVVLATVAEAMDPAALARLVADARATYMMATPTTWAALISAGWTGDRNLTAVSAGEALTDGLASALLPRCRTVWNAYGPSETTVVSNVAQLAHGDTVTVGKALPNVRVYIADRRGRLQPLGVPGEIVIGGVAVARGYLNRPDENARRFGDDPLHPGERIYRTGDRGRLLPDGRVQHLGRFDDQVKIRGFRIEPGEIESALCEHPEVGSCAVVARDAPNGEQQLVAYIVGEPGRPSDAQARDWLRRRLPDYMVPSLFVRLGALPITASGKIDRAALPAPSPRGTDHTGAQQPRTDTERRVAALWAELLAMPVTDVNCDFFDMGGHSLLAAQLVSGVERTFGVKLPLATFADHGRTVAELAQLLDAESPPKTDQVTSVPPLHFIFSGMSSAMSLRHFTAQWGGAQPVHALVPEQPSGLFDRSVTIEQHARQALSAIRGRQPDGPLALVGYSLGGLVAYEVARQAVEAGQQVCWLGVLDMLAPTPSMKQQLVAEMTLRWRFRRLRRQPVRVRWAKYREVALRALRSGRLWPRNDFDYYGATEIACRYQQPGHAVPMHLFVGEATAADMEADLLGWNEYHEGTLTVHRLDTNHVGLLEPSGVEQVAPMILESLRKARASTLA